MNKDEIAQQANQLQEDAGVKGVFPVELDKIAAFLGYTVSLYTPTEDGSEQISGAVDYKDKKIYINIKENIYRKYFTYAHEIAHIVLHCNHEADANGVFDYRNFPDLTPEEMRLESEADEFAADLLMPKDKFTKKWKDFKGNIYKMQSYFVASLGAIGYRIDKLGLRYYDE